MGKLTDIVYKCLKENERAYEILLLRDLHDNTFTALAEEYGVCVATVMSTYYQIKIRQIRLYINHLAIVHGHETTTSFMELFHKANDCYRDYKYVTGYFEKEYPDILTEYRAGEPGLPKPFLASMPPYREAWSKYTIRRVVKLREDEKLTYIEIGRKLKMTASSTEHIYQHYYHKKFLDLSNKIIAATGKTNLRRDYYRITRNSKKRLKLLLADYPEFPK